MNAMKSREWVTAQGRLKERWNALTDEDLRFAETQHDELLARIEKRTGEPRDVIERAVNEAFLP
jgi:uncharacterized protein YjbJ (UPF0337 family)